MFTKSEIIEMITRQYNVRQTVIDYMITNLMKLSDFEIRNEFKTACGIELQKFGTMYCLAA